MDTMYRWLLDGKVQLDETTGIASIEDVSVSVTDKLGKLSHWAKGDILKCKISLLKNGSLLADNKGIRFNIVVTEAKLKGKILYVEGPRYKAILRRTV